MNYIEEAIEAAQRNPSKCRTLKWGNHLAIGAYGVGTRSQATIACQHKLPADDGVIVIEWAAPAGHDDDPMSQGGYIALRPDDGTMIRQRAWAWSDVQAAIEFGVANNQIKA